jgi:hypothetical protein
VAPHLTLSQWRRAGGGDSAIVVCGTRRSAPGPWRRRGRSIIPVGKWSKAANVPDAKVTDPIACPSGMPGVRVGQ